MAFPADSQNPLTKKSKPTYPTDIIAVVFPEEIIEFERFWTKLKSLGKFKRANLKNSQPTTKKILALGPSAAKFLKNNKGEVWELFVAGSPIVKKDKIIPYQSPPQKWVNLFLKIKPKNKSNSPLVFLTTPRLKTDSLAVAELCKEVGILTRVIVVTSEKMALQSLISIHNKKTSTWGIKLAHDLKIITPRVLFLSLKLQYRDGIPIFVRTKHEVLAGGIATIEPIMDPQWVLNRFLSTETKPPYTKQAKLFYNTQALKSLRIKTTLLKEMKGQPISW
jgi:hypothetical protein